MKPLGKYLLVHLFRTLMYYYVNYQFVLTPILVSAALFLLNYRSHKFLSCYTQNYEREKYKNSCFNVIIYTIVKVKYLME